MDSHLRLLRASRADPPARIANDPARRSIYNAALQQFEELVGAAASVGPATSPLLLFYAISQASRAIVALYGEHAEITAHGLQEDRDVQPDDLLHRRFVPTPRKRDAFGAVARAIGAPALGAGVELGAVWAALPHAYGLPRESWRADWRMVLDADIDPPKVIGDDVHVAVASFGGNPLVSAIETLATGYPSIPPGTRMSMRGGAEVRPGGWIADLFIPTSQVDPTTVLDQIAPILDDAGTRAVMPRIGDESAPLPPFMLWWVLLYGLSITARYHPGPWARALAVDESSLAVPLEAMLENAHEALPVLVYEAVFLSRSPSASTAPGVD